MGFLLSLGRKTRAQRESSCSAHVGFVSSVSDQYFDSLLFDGWSNVLDGFFCCPRFAFPPQLPWEHFPSSSLIAAGRMHEEREGTMNKKSLAEIAKQMAGIDIAILSTHAADGQIANRPMSNNGDVAYDGTSYYFTFEKARTVADIERDANVALGFTSEGGIFTNGLYVAVEGRAELIRDKAAFAAHWTFDLDKWFDKGVDTPGIVLIRVQAKRITYWEGAEEGEVSL
jgi:general stress protein 26